MAESLDTIRQLELLRLDYYLTKLTPQIKKGNTAAIEVALKISEQRAKLLGLYAPIEIKVYHSKQARIEKQINLFIDGVSTHEHIPEYLKEIIINSARQYLEESFAAD